MSKPALCKIAEWPSVGKNKRGQGKRREPAFSGLLSNEGQSVVHLWLGVCWLIFACVMLIGPWADPAMPWPTIWGRGISLGWFGIAMALYNLLRWWLDRCSRKAACRARKESPLQRRRALESQESKPAAAPNPAFDFPTDPPGHDPARRKS